MKRIRTYPSLKHWRAARGFSQRDAAAFLGCSQSKYAKLELNRTAPRPKVGMAISQTTGVPFEIVMGAA
jgi:transcriptional regulator with XRE-family HTH domain